MLTLVAIFLGITLSSTFRFDFRQSRRTFKSNLTAITGLTEYKSQSEKVAMLRKMLNDSESIFIMPCCYDGLTAKLIQQAGFNLTFMTGFGVSATLGLPDSGLISVGEMVQAGSVICDNLPNMPCIGDGDTGYGNELNVERTVQRYAQIGFAGIMIEDQVSPKRCGHVAGKQVVSREEAYARIAAAVRARDQGQDIVILARTDARGPIGFEEALERCKMFRKLGADWTFLEAPQTEEEMRRYCAEVDGPKLANMLEFGATPVLPPATLHKMGYTVAAYPVTLLSASIRAMSQTLQLLKEGRPTDSMILDFAELKKVVGFDDYETEMNYFRKRECLIKRLTD